MQNQSKSHPSFWIVGVSRLIPRPFTAFIDDFGNLRRLDFVKAAIVLAD